MAILEEEIKSGHLDQHLRQLDQLERLKGGTSHLGAYCRTCCEESSILCCHVLTSGGQPFGRIDVRFPKRVDDYAFTSGVFVHCPGLAPIQIPRQGLFSQNTARFAYDFLYTALQGQAKMLPKPPLGG